MSDLNYHTILERLGQKISDNPFIEKLHRELIKPIQYDTDRSILQEFLHYIHFPSLSTFLTLALLLFISCFILAWIYRLYFHRLSCFPGPKLAAVSNAYLCYILLSGKSHLLIANLHKKYGPYVRVAPNEISFATVSSFRDIYGRSPHRKYFEKGAFYRGATANPKGYSGLPLDTDPTSHAIKHRIFAPAFSYTAQTEFSPIMSLYIRSMVSKILHHRRQGRHQQNVLQWLHWCTTDISTDFIFGKEFGELENEESHAWNKIPTNAVFLGQVVEAVRQMGVGWVLRVTGVKRLAGKGIRRRVEFTRRWIEGRLKNGGKKGHKDIFTYLLSTPAGLELASDLDNLSQNIFEILGASIETTTSTVSAILFHVLSKPTIAARLSSDLRAAFASHDEITTQTLKSIPYLDAVINEGMRLFPSVPQGLPRDSPGETVDGHYMPRGTIVSTPTYTMGHHPEYWEDPETFDPERWMDGAGEKGKYAGDVKEASQPFLMGPRACIGQVMNGHEVRLMLAHLFWSFDMRLAEGMGDWIERCEVYMVWKKPKLWIEVEERGDEVMGKK